METFEGQTQKQCYEMAGRKVVENGGKKWYYENGGRKKGVLVDGQTIFKV